MLRARTVKRAACALIFAIACGATPDAFAGGNVQGTACTPNNSTSAGIGTGAVTDANNLVCVSNVWQYPVYVMQSAAAAAGSSCSTYPAGAQRYNTTLGNLEFCNGTTWYQVPAYATACGTPSGLSFTNLTGQSLNTVVTSSTATVTFSGCTAGTALSVSVSGAATAQISVNGGAWATSGAISSGQTLKVRLTSSGSVSTLLTATVTVAATSTNWTVTTRAGSLIVFATDSTYFGYGIGGLSGADAICQSAAGSAGYAGTYKAVLSDDTTSAASRLTLSYPIVNGYDGSTVATSGFFSGTLNGPILDPWTGSFGPGDVDWTGSNPDGSIATGYTCSSWTSTSASGESGFDPDYSGGGDWLSWNAYSCGTGGTALGLYCIQQ